MPRFNQRGPEGQGPMTGRKRGRCTNYGENLKNQNTVPAENQTGDQQENFQGRGFGSDRRKSGKGRGVGRQNRFRGGDR